ncbi:MAG: helix-turn-helix domain-containing protein [Rhodospirillales bacterium]|nr:helix-turn-helix domain-containing protein [Rhodospirillales bacterium]
MLPPPLGAAGEGGGFATVAGAARPTAPVPPRPAMPPITPPITSPFQAPEPNWIPRGVPLTPPPIAPPPVAAPPAAPPSPAPPSPAPPSPDPPPASAGEMELMPLAEMERRLALVALRRTGFDVTRAAALLEIHPSTLYRKLKAWQESGVAQ